MCDFFACCFCFPDDPVDDDPRKDFANRWQVSMKDAPAQNTGFCLYGCFCPWCAQYQLRHRALGGDMTKYTCCQSYFSMCCCTPGQVGEQNSPELCLCLEVCCCLSCAVSATRFYIMDQYNIVSDPCDSRIIRFNNFMQLLSCVLNLLAICIEELRDAAFIVDLIAKVVYFSTVGCMSAQMEAELSFREQHGAAGAGTAAPPPVQGMDRSGAPPPPTGQQEMAYMQQQQQQQQQMSGYPMQGQQAGYPMQGQQAGYPMQGQVPYATAHAVEAKPVATQ